MIDSHKHLPLGVRAFLGLVLIFTLLHWYILLARVPSFHGMPDWFWKFTYRPIVSVWMLPILAFTPFLAYSVVHVRMSTRVALFVIFSIGLCHQFGFALLEGRGIDGLRDRMVYTGHAEFVDIAVKYHGNALSVARHYEELVKSGELGTYANSKPPGVLLLYIATSWICNKSGCLPEQKAETLRTFASFLWPILSYVVLLPLYIMTKTLFGKKTAILSCLLYVFIPSVTLVTLHADQVFFPTLFVVPVALAVLAVRQNRLWPCALSGIAVFIALYCTFAMVFCFPLVGALSLAVVLRSSHDSATRLRYVVRHAAIFSIGFFAAWMFFKVAFSYDPVSLFRHATAHHQSWRGWDGSLRTTAYWAFLNGIEYVFWLGVPFAFGVYTSAVRSLTLWNLRHPTPRVMLSLAVLLIVSCLMILGRTKGEVARIWLFLTPCLSVMVAGELVALTKQHNLYLLACFVFQWVTILVTKWRQDFC